MQDYHQLDIWNRAMDYTAAIYPFSAQLPSDERYNLTSQIRTNPEFARFVGYGYRSLKEVVTCLELCERLELATSSSVAPLVDEGNQISRMAYSFMQRLGQNS